MDIQQLIIILVIGALAGWLAGNLMRRGGYGLLINIVIGVIGAILGGYLFGVLGISAGGGLIGSLITSVVGAIVLLALVRVIKRL